MKFFIYFAVMALPVSGWAGWNLRNSLELVPQYRHLNQTGFAGDQDVADVFGMLNSDGVWSTKSFALELKPEIRAVQSKYVKGGTNNSVSVKTSQRTLHTRRTLAFEKEFESYFDFDRLNLKYTFTNGLQGPPNSSKRRLKTHGSKKLYHLSLIHISEPRDYAASRMPSSA